MPLPVAWTLTPLVHATTEQLITELASTIEELCTLLEEIAFTEITAGKQDSEVITGKGHRDALTEKKWLILRLLDERRATRP